MSSEWPLQKAWDEGHRVTVVQRLLVHRGATQDSQKLEADGMVGDLTWPALVVQVKQGDEGEAVTAAQELLQPRMVGVLDLEPTGTFNADTDKAARSFRSGTASTSTGSSGPSPGTASSWPTKLPRGPNRKETRPAGCDG